MTANNPNCVKLNSVASLVINNAVITINTAPKKYEHVMTERLAGYFLKTDAWKFYHKELNIRRIRPSMR